MAKSDAKQLDQTITLDTSNETDVIDCSIEEIYCQNEFFKTPRSHLKRNYGSPKKNEVISLKAFQFKTEDKQVKIQAPDKGGNGSGCKRRSNFKSNDSVISDNSVIASSTPGTPRRNGNRDDAILNNLIPGLKDSPYLPFLGKSKLDRIGKWLNENDLETVTTPPFSTNKRSSSRLRKASSTRSLTSQSKKNDSPDSSAIDSEVEKVLVAVYGKDWKAKNVLKKSKTEPKKSKKQIFSTKADISNKARTEVKSVKTSRRNILKTGVSRGLISSGNSDNLNSPCSLGVRKLNESVSSDDDFIVKNLRSRSRQKILSPSSTTSSKKTMVNNNREDRNPIVARRSLRRRVVRSPCRCPHQCEGNECPTRTFLASLSVSTPSRRCDPEAQDFKLNFGAKKKELAARLFKLFNEEVFCNGLPVDMVVSWNVKMRRTAGYCRNRKFFKSTGEVKRTCRIELSTKIVDRADRLRDTLIHELCHAATWIIDGILDGHGPVWTKWSCAAMKKFPELPQIKRCHNYNTTSKYTYKCVGCGYSVHRYSKSIDMERKRCGYCYGALELFVNKIKRGKREVPEYKMVRTPAPNRFALFVKDNYRNVKEGNKNATHGEIMKILSERYAQTKACATKTTDKK